MATHSGVPSCFKRRRRYTPLVVATTFIIGGFVILWAERRPQSQTRVASVSATVEAPQSVVSSSYGGVVTESFVQNGSQVRRGDRLFTVEYTDGTRLQWIYFLPSTVQAMFRCLLIG